jgi:hypothetical protein
MNFFPSLLSLNGELPAGLTELGVAPQVGLRRCEADLRRMGASFFLSCLERRKRNSRWHQDLRPLRKVCSRTVSASQIASIDLYQHEYSCLDDTVLL